MAKYGMIIDCSKCIGCYNCFLACQDEFCGNDYPGYSAAAPMSGHDWMKVVSRERGAYPKVKVSFFPKTCLQCENAKCVEAAKNNAVYRRPDGIIIIDPEKAAGQKELIGSCPYGAIHWNEEKQIPQKCNMCAHMIDQGEKEPRCVESCPTEALIFGDLDDPNSDISKIMAQGQAEIPHPERGLETKVRYLHRHKRFVAGTIIDKAKKECADGVTVILTPRIKDTVSDGIAMAKVTTNTEAVTTKTNGFGDFEFEGLQPNADFHLEFVVDGNTTFETKVNTKRDVYLGEVVI